MQRLLGAVHRIAAARAVDMYIEQSRRYQSALHVDALAVGRQLLRRYNPDDFFIKQQCLSFQNTVVHDQPPITNCFHPATLLFLLFAVLWNHRRQLTDASMVLCNQKLDGNALFHKHLFMLGQNIFGKAAVGKVPGQILLGKAAQLKVFQRLLKQLVIIGLKPDFSPVL